MIKKLIVVLFVVAMLLLIVVPALAQSPHDGPCGPWDGDVGATDTRGPDFRPASPAIKAACLKYLAKQIPGSHHRTRKKGGERYRTAVQQFEARRIFAEGRGSKITY